MFMNMLQLARMNNLLRHSPPESLGFTKKPGKHTPQLTSIAEAMHVRVYGHPP